MVYFLQKGRVGAIRRYEKCGVPMYSAGMDD
nr:MAG TPA: hypothetical protein [Caudoviricetes sp.]